MSELSIKPTTISSPSGRVAQEFDHFGRHVRTRDTLTGKTLREFEYDASGQVVGILDEQRTRTAIERHADGRARAVVAQSGQRTELLYDASGRLEVVRDPLRNEHRMSYQAGGLLKSFQRPGAEASSVSYNSDGRLESDANALLGGWTLSRSKLSDGRRVQLVSAEGRIQTYDSRTGPNGEKIRIAQHRDGSISSRAVDKDGSVLETSSSGTEVDITVAPDPRFGMLAPQRSVRMRTPGGRTLIATTVRTTTLADAEDPYSLQSWSEARTVNGRRYESTYEAANSVLSSTTPMGRTRTVVLNTEGKPAIITAPGMAAVTYGYDPQGRIGTRQHL